MRVSFIEAGVRLTPIVALERLARYLECVPPFRRGRRRGEYREELEAAVLRAIRRARRNRKTLRKART